MKFLELTAPILRPQVSDIAKKFVLLQPGTCITGDSVYNAFIAAGLQKVNYTYDIRGNIFCINCNSSGALDQSKVFSLKLDYHQDGRYFNGLLSRQTWKSSADTVSRRYLYDYDKSYRLTRGAFTGKSPENFSLPKIRYDANGNIDSLQRNGKTGVNAFGLIDDLKYNYSPNSNRLSAIDDNSNASLGFKNVAGSNEFTYNTIGDQKTDNNKGITNIEYNYLGLIDKVHFGSTKRIENIYTSDGQKLSTKFINGSTVLNKDYVGELIYINDTLRSVWHDEGRVTFDNSAKPAYQYFINDHQGSTRIVFQALNNSTFIAQRIDYGVTGDIISEFPNNQNLLTHTFQGKEFQDGFGFDFVTRTYDPYTVRMLQVDGANQFASGYTGMGNMPNFGVDPDGQAVHIAAGAAIGGTINLIGQAIKGNVKNFKQGALAFGMGAIAGGLAAATGGASLTAGQLALQSAVGQIPGPNINLGGGFSASISPALMMGAQGWSLGANLGVGFSSGSFSAGIGTGVGYGHSNVTGRTGWSSSIGGGFAVGGENFSAGIYTNKYNSGETSQRTSLIAFRGKDWSLQYENDWHPGLTKYGHVSDGGDRFRTAALMGSYKDVSIGFNLFTGDPGLESENRTRGIRHIEGFMDTYTNQNGSSPDKYRLGAAFIGYKNLKAGVNSEWIRHGIQNFGIHRPQNIPYFMMKSKSFSLYGNVGLQNPFSLW